MKRSFFEQIVLYEYRYLIAYTILILVATYSIFWRLGTLLPGISLAEASSALTSLSLESLRESPIDLPYHLIQSVVINVLGATPFAIRLASAVLASLSVILFYLILLRSYSRRVAITATLLFASSSWFLTFARLGIPEISVIFWSLLLVYSAIKTYETHSLFWIVILAIAAGLGIYSQYFIYLLIIGAIVTFPIIKGTKMQLKKHYPLIAVSVFILLVSPLVYAVINNPQIITSLLGLPENWPEPKLLLAQLLDTVSYLFWRSEPNWEFNLGSLPILDIFSASMFALGLYYLDQEVSRTLAKYTLIALGVMLVVISVNPQPSAFVILMPLVYLLISAGIVMLFTQWYETFPYNPIARMAIVIPLAIALSSVIYYHHQRYFVAWPNTPEVIVNYPPTYTYLLEEVVAHQDQMGIILVSDNEAKYGELIEKLYPNIKSTITADAITSDDLIIITEDAYNQLTKDQQANLPKGLKIIPSPYESYPTVIRVHSPV